MLSSLYQLLTIHSFCLRLSVCLRQLTEAVALRNDDVTRELTPLPPQKDLEERTVSIYHVDCWEAHWPNG